MVDRMVEAIVLAVELVHCPTTRAASFQLIAVAVLALPCATGVPSRQKSLFDWSVRTEASGCQAARALRVTTWVPLT